MSKKRKHSISYSLAYVRVCEWAREPKTYAQPAPDMLDMAEVHAIRVKDPFVLEVINRCRFNNRAIEDTPTPKRPGSTNESLKQVKLKTFRPPVIELSPLVEEPVGATYCLIYSCEDRKKQV